MRTSKRQQELETENAALRKALRQIWDVSRRVETAERAAVQLGAAHGLATVALDLLPCGHPRSGSRLERVALSRRYRTRCLICEPETEG